MHRDNQASVEFLRNGCQKAGFVRSETSMKWLQRAAIGGCLRDSTSFGSIVRLETPYDRFREHTYQHQHSGWCFFMEKRPGRLRNGSFRPLSSCKSP